MLERFKPSKLCFVIKKNIQNCLINRWYQVFSIIYTLLYNCWVEAKVHVSTNIFGNELTACL